MADVNVPVADSIRVIDHAVFGRHVIIWALSLPDRRPSTIGELKTNFPGAAAAMSFPAHVQDTDAIDFSQGTKDRHNISLPPLHKLLPMLEYLEQTPMDYVDTADLGFDAADPPSIPTKPGVDEYKAPAFYQDFVDGLPFDPIEYFLNRVGDYSYNGCR